jgi:hypothetical protein
MIKAPFLDVSTKDGDERIYEDDLPLVTARDLKRLRMTREVLHRCFAEGVRRMQELLGRIEHGAGQLLKKP